MVFVLVGGIYTVIKTKAAVTVEELGEQYFLIGPYNESCVRTEVEIMEPQNEACSKAIRQMRDNGIKVSIVLSIVSFLPCHFVSSVFMSFGAVALFKSVNVSS